MNDTYSKYIWRISTRIVWKISHRTVKGFFLNWRHTSKTRTLRINIISINVSPQQCCGFGMFIPDPIFSFRIYFPYGMVCNRMLVSALSQSIKVWIQFNIAWRFPGTATKRCITKVNVTWCSQGFGSVFIFSGSGSSVWGWILIRIQVFL
jgi:hypothetical protein